MTPTERITRNEAILQGADPGPTKLQKAFWWAFPKFLVVAVLSGISYGALLLAKQDWDEATAVRARHAQLLVQQNNWIAEHRCHRTGYDSGDAIYTCADGDVYKRRDMPIEDK